VDLDVWATLSPKETGPGNEPPRWIPGGIDVRVLWSAAVLGIAGNALVGLVQEQATQMRTPLLLSLLTMAILLPLGAFISARLRHEARRLGSAILGWAWRPRRLANTGTSLAAVLVAPYFLGLGASPLIEITLVAGLLVQLVSLPLQQADSLDRRTLIRLLMDATTTDEEKWVIREWSAARDASLPWPEQWDFLGPFACLVATLLVAARLLSSR
jgi:hypothetical protein